MDQTFVLILASVLFVAAAVMYPGLVLDIVVRTFKGICSLLYDGICLLFAWAG